MRQRRASLAVLFCGAPEKWEARPARAKWRWLGSGLRLIDETGRQSALVERLHLRAGHNHLDHSMANDLSVEADVNEISPQHLGPKDD